MTAICVKMIVQSWSAKGPKLMRVWRKFGMTCLDKAPRGREDADARVALATKHSR